MCNLPTSFTLKVINWKLNEPFTIKIDLQSANNNHFTKVLFDDYEYFWKFLNYIINSSNNAAENVRMMSSASKDRPDVASR